MADYRYTLEAYQGLSSRYTCPRCQKHRQFVRYIDTHTGVHLGQEVGRCNREIKCGITIKPNNILLITTYTKFYLSILSLRWPKKYPILVSDWLERGASQEVRRQGGDLADYLIAASALLRGGQFESEFVCSPVLFGKIGFVPLIYTRTSTNEVLFNLKIRSYRLYGNKMA